MRIKNTLSGLATAAFSIASLGVLPYMSLKKNDIAIDANSNSNNSHDTHGIPVTDISMGVYASYFSGAKDSQFSLAMRAENTFGMNNALNQNFVGKDAPWIMLDSLSDGRYGSRTGENMAGAHFIAMYHKDTKQIVITMPGMEYDDSLKDTLTDAKQLVTGGYEQAKALKAYTDDVVEKIAANEFKDANGQTLEIAGEKPIIASHSMGSKPIHLMSLAGFKTVMFEPRPVTENYIDALRDMNSEVFGDSLDTNTIKDSLDKNTISIRAATANIWNSPLMPWTKVHKIANTLIYGTGKEATFADRHVAGDHAAEVLVPSLVKSKDLNSAANEAPKGKSGMVIQAI